MGILTGSSDVLISADNNKCLKSPVPPGAGVRWVGLQNRGYVAQIAISVRGEQDMAMKSFASFEVRTDEPLGREGMEGALLRWIVQQLDSVGITCGRIRSGSFCVFTRCRVGQSAVNLGIMAATRLSEHYVRCAVHCVSHVPLWKRLLVGTSPESSGRGESLDRICAEVDGILASDPDIGRVKWMTREELFKFEKESG